MLFNGKLGRGFNLMIWVKIAKLKLANLNLMHVRAYDIKCSIAKFKLHQYWEPFYKI